MISEGLKNNSTLTILYLGCEEKKETVILLSKTWKITQCNTWTGNNFSWETEKELGIR